MPSSSNSIELSESDRILMLAVRAWGVLAASNGADAWGPSFWDRLEPSWGRRLRDAWDRGLEGRRAIENDSAAALAELGRVHRAEARVDPARVHPTWWARALREESPAVRRTVAATAPEPVRAGLLLDNDDLRTDRPADLEVRAWALSLWSERLVGGEPERADDPPAIVAMARLAPRAGYRLCHCAGLIKLVLADRDAIGENTAPADRARGQWFKDRLASAGPELIAVARHDVQSQSAQALAPRRRAARLGLLTIARLLADVEPFRVRWALQHWPYTIAKLARTLMPPEAKRSTAVASVEARVLKTAWDRLNLEGWSTIAWPEGHD